MSAVIIVLAILAFYFYRKAKNPNAYDEFSEDQLFKRLWYLPIVQLVVCLVVFFLGYVGVQICMQQSPWLADAVRDNFGMFGTIGAELINQNLQDNLAPVLVQADRLHGWSQYLLYAAIISLGLQVFALKEKKVSMEIILGITGIISVAAIYLAYQIACTMDLAMNVFLSNETLGLLSNYPGHAIEQGLDCAGILFIILTIYHYGHYNYLARYYGEPVKNINPMARFVKEPQTHLTVGLKSEEHSTEDTKRCPYCGEEILTVAKKCKHCGEWLNKEPEQPHKEYMACPVCGEQVEEGRAVCPHCTEPLVDVRQSVSDPKPEDMIQPDDEVQTEVNEKAVDLGLSVLWAVCNVGGDAESPVGGLYGWGDPSGEQTSKDVNDYIKKEGDQDIKTPQNISGTQYDIATAMWGEGWRMPSRKEWEELIENCEWTGCSVLNVVGCRVEGPNGNSIFLPNTGLRLGEDVTKTGAGYYWASEMVEGNSDCAYSYSFDIEKYSSEIIDVVSTKNFIYSGRAVRPVREK